MYSVADYGRMIADRARMAAYEQALRQVVRPGAVVVDIGAGTGIFSLLACQMGARRVYAVEPDDSIMVAREIALANGCDDRIEFIQQLSTQVTLPERADVIVSDLRGVLPPLEQHIPSIIDARQRFLAPGGVLIPQADTVLVALAHAPDVHAGYASPWVENAYGLDMSAGYRIVTNTWRRVDLRPDQLISEPQEWAVLDYCTIQGADVSSTLTWAIERPAVAHGIAVWFDAALAEGVRFSTAPGAPETIYGNAFFPLSELVTLEPGDSVVLTLSASLVGGDYIWRWDTGVTAGASGAKLKARFSQSTFWGSPLSPARLRKRAHSFAPCLNATGQVDRLILDLMSRGQPLGEIAHEVRRQFPDHFVDWHAAMTHVGELSLRYSE